MGAKRQKYGTNQGRNRDKSTPSDILIQAHKKSVKTLFLAGFISEVNVLLVVQVWLYDV